MYMYSSSLHVSIITAVIGRVNLFGSFTAAFYDEFNYATVPWKELLQLQFKYYIAF